MELDEKVTRAVRYVSRFTLSEAEARAAIVAVFDWLADPGIDAIIAGHEAAVGAFDLNAAYTRIWTAMLDAKRKEALGD